MRGRRGRPPKAQLKHEPTAGPVRGLRPRRGLRAKPRGTSDEDYITLNEGAIILQHAAGGKCDPRCWGAEEEAEGRPEAGGGGAPWAGWFTTTTRATRMRMKTRSVWNRTRKSTRRSLLRTKSRRKKKKTRRPSTSLITWRSWTSWRKTMPVYARRAATAAIAGTGRFGDRPVRESRRARGPTQTIALLLSETLKMDPGASLCWQRPRS